MRLAPLVLVLALAPSPARADVVPYGWRPPPAREEMHVELFRASVGEWMQPDERFLLAARTHPRCVAAASRRASGFGGGRRCPIELTTDG